MACYCLYAYGFAVGYGYNHDKLRNTKKVKVVATTVVFHFTTNINNKEIVMSTLLRIEAKEHFHVQGLKRAFDMAPIVSIHDYVVNNLKTISRNKNLEFNIGRATVIYSVDEFNTIHLISGWVGNRSKKVVA